MEKKKQTYRRLRTTRSAFQNAFLTVKVRITDGKMAAQKIRANTKKI